MALNKQKGNMYPFVTHTWNPIRGECPHSCTYCYMKSFPPQGPIRLVDYELDTNLGLDNFIFIGSSTDMFCTKVKTHDIKRVLSYCKAFGNQYLFQTKNPERLYELIRAFPEKSILGVTLETNKDLHFSDAPPPEKRYEAMKSIAGVKKMVSIEPVMDFDIDVLFDWIKDIDPEFVSIGADTKRSSLPEPTAPKLREFIDMLKTLCKVYQKKNLGRLIK